MKTWKITYMYDGLKELTIMTDDLLDVIRERFSRYMNPRIDSIVKIEQVPEDSE